MNCKNCNMITPTFGGKHKKYCNLNCQREYEKKISKINFSPISCIICNKEFTPKSKQNKCCSPHCKYLKDLSRRSKKPKTKICKVCNKEFKPYTSLDKFCSKECRIENVKANRVRRLKGFKSWSKESLQKITGENNPCYRNGVYSKGANKTSIGQRLFTKNAKEIEQKMFENEGYKYCENCKISNAIRYERHHIIYRSEKPLHPNLHDKENILIVCISCHNEFHRIKSKRNNLVLKRGLDKIFGQDVLK